MLAAAAACPASAAQRECADRTAESSRAGHRSTAPRRCRPPAPAVRRRRGQRRDRGRRLRAVDQREPFLRRRASPGEPGARERVGARPDARPVATVASPSPISTSARCASGARSPLAPTDPRLGTRGCTPRLSIASSSSSVSRPDAREAFREHVCAQRHRRAHGADGQRLADAGGVAAQQIQLQRAELVARNRAFRRARRSRC